VARRGGPDPDPAHLVPSFGCNLACTYCYQEPFDPDGAGLIAPEAIDAFFAWSTGTTSAARSFPTSPLRRRAAPRHAAHRDRIERFVDGARARRLQLAVVTNGHDLAAYVPTLAAAPIKEVQVTIDGPRELHDARRPHRGGQGTFDRIVAGIDALVAAGLPSTCGWSPTRRTCLGCPSWRPSPRRVAGSTSRPPASRRRSAATTSCSAAPAAGPRRPPRPVEVWARYLELCEAHPALRRFTRPLPRHRPPGLGRRAAATQLRRLPAAKTEWAFSPDGGVYGCTATWATAAPARLLPPRGEPRRGGHRALERPEHAHHARLPGLCAGAGLWRRLRRGGLVPDRLGAGDRLPPVRELYGLGPASRPGSVSVAGTHHQGCLTCGAALVYGQDAAPVTCALCGAAGRSPWPAPTATSCATPATPRRRAR